MKKIQICVKRGSSRTTYYDVIVDNKQTLDDAKAIVKKALHLTSLDYIGRGASGVQPAGQYNKFKPGTILDGDWTSYSFGDVIVKGE